LVVGVHIIMGIPPPIIIMGAPIAIIEVIASQRSFMRAIIDGSVGIIFMTMPSFVISQDILHIIGDMPLIIMGIIIMPMPFIMPPIIGIGIMPFIMPPIIGIIGIIPPIGIEPCIPFIGIDCIGIIEPFIIEPFIIGMAFMALSSRRGRPTRRHRGVAGHRSLFGRNLIRVPRAAGSDRPAPWAFRLS